MRVWLRRTVSVLGIYAVALHAILAAVAGPLAAAPAFDPFSVICHSGPAAPSTTEQTPANQTPSKACDHCSLCFVAAALGGPDAIPAGRLAPPSILHVLTPVSTAARVHLAASPHLPRGPPQRA